MEILRAGFALAVAQVGDLWPPLWEFIRAGFSTLWDLAVGTFQAKFLQAIAIIQHRFREMILDMAVNLAIYSNPITLAQSLLPGFNRENTAAPIRRALGMDGSEAEINRLTQDRILSETTTAARALALATNRFNASSAAGDSAGVIAARADITGIQQLAWRDGLIREMENAGTGGGPSGGFSSEATNGLAMAGGFGSLAQLNLDGRFTMEERIATAEERIVALTTVQNQILQEICSGVANLLDGLDLRVA